MGARHRGEPRSAAEARDRADPLARLRAAFRLPPGQVYLDGNSLGPVSEAALARVRAVVEQQWRADAIASWNRHGWIELPRRVGAKIARLVGAAPDHVVAADSTTVNLFRVVAAALRLRPDRHTIAVEADNFPADNYVVQGLQSLAIALGRDVRVRALEGDDWAAQLDDDVACLAASGVNYRSGRLRDVEGTTRAVHGHGGLAVWDLAHSAGAVEVQLDAWDVDFAVGCGYKYLNGGPGAPAFLYVHPRWHAEAVTPTWGWLGHAEPFAFDPAFRPAEGVAGWVCGTPPVISMAALDAALDVWEGVALADVRAKSIALTEAFIAGVEASVSDPALTLASPRDPAQRGSQVALRHPEAYAVVQALIARGIVGDFRAPDVLRFGFTPLYLRHVDVWDAVAALADVLATRAWDRPELRRPVAGHAARSLVT
jgi:kynureninase